jgi:hypothetical protein
MFCSLLIVYVRVLCRYDHTSAAVFELTFVPVPPPPVPAPGPSAASTPAHTANMTATQREAALARAKQQQKEALAAHHHSVYPASCRVLAVRTKQGMSYFTDYVFGENGDWHHVLLTHDKSGVALHIDGRFVQKHNLITSPTIASPQPASAGAGAGSGSSAAPSSGSSGSGLTSASASSATSSAVLAPVVMEYFASDVSAKRPLIGHIGAPPRPAPTTTASSVASSASSVSASGSASVAVGSVPASSASNAAAPSARSTSFSGACGTIHFFEGVLEEKHAQAIYNEGTLFTATSFEKQLNISLKRFLAVQPSDFKEQPSPASAVVSAAAGVSSSAGGGSGVVGSGSVTSVGGVSVGGGVGSAVGAGGSGDVVSAPASNNSKLSLLSPPDSPTAPHAHAHSHHTHLDGRVVMSPLLLETSLSSLLPDSNRRKSVVEFGSGVSSSGVTSTASTASAGASGSGPGSHSHSPARRKNSGSPPTSNSGKGKTAANSGNASNPSAGGSGVSGSSGGSSSSSGSSGNSGHNSRHRSPPHSSGGSRSRRTRKSRATHTPVPAPLSQSGAAASATTSTLTPPITTSSVSSGSHARTASLSATTKRGADSSSSSEVAALTLALTAASSPPQLPAAAPGSMGGGVLLPNSALLASGAAASSGSGVSGGGGTSSASSTPPSTSSAVVAAIISAPNSTAGNTNLGAVTSASTTTATAASASASSAAPTGAGSNSSSTTGASASWHMPKVKAGVDVHTTRPLCTEIRSVKGGLYLCLPFLAMGSAQQVAALRILHGLLENYRVNLTDFLKANGFLVLGHLLRDPNNELTRETFDVLMDLVASPTRYNAAASAPFHHHSALSASSSSSLSWIHSSPHHHHSSHSLSHSHNHHHHHSHHHSKAGAVSKPAVPRLSLTNMSGVMLILDLLRDGACDVPTRRQALHTLVQVTTSELHTANLDAWRAEGSGPGLMALIELLRVAEDRGERALFAPLLQIVEHVIVLGKLKTEELDLLMQWLVVEAEDYRHVLPPGSAPATATPTPPPTPPPTTSSSSSSAQPASGAASAAAAAAAAAAEAQVLHSYQPHLLEERIYVLNLLLTIISKRPELAIHIYKNLSGFDVPLLLLRSKSERVRAEAIRLLGLMFSAAPKYGVAFAKAQMYDVMYVMLVSKHTQPLTAAVALNAMTAAAAVSAPVSATTSAPASATAGAGSSAGGGGGSAAAIGRTTLSALEKLALGAYVCQPEVPAAAAAAGGSAGSDQKREHSVSTSRVSRSDTTSGGSRELLHVDAVRVLFQVLREVPAPHLHVRYLKKLRLLVEAHPNNCDKLLDADWLSWGRAYLHALYALHAGMAAVQGSGSGSDTGAAAPASSASATSPVSASAATSNALSVLPAISPTALSGGGGSTSPTSGGSGGSGGERAERRSAASSGMQKAIDSFLRIVQILAVRELTRSYKVSRIGKVKDMVESADFQAAVIESVVHHLEHRPMLDPSGASNFLRNLATVYTDVEQIAAPPISPTTSTALTTTSSGASAGSAASAAPSVGSGGLHPSTLVRLANVINLMASQSSSDVRTKMKDNELFAMRDALVLHCIRFDMGAQHRLETFRTWNLEMLAGTLYPAPSPFSLFTLCFRVAGYSLRYVASCCVMCVCCVQRIPNFVSRKRCCISCTGFTTFRRWRHATASASANATPKRAAPSPPPPLPPPLPLPQRSLCLRPKSTCVWLQPSQTFCARNWACTTISAAPFSNSSAICTSVRCCSLTSIQRTLERAGMRRASPLWHSSSRCSRLLSSLPRPPPPLPLPPLPPLLRPLRPAPPHRRLWPPPHLWL